MKLGTSGREFFNYILLVYKSYLYMVGNDFDVFIKELIHRHNFVVNHKKC